MSLDKDSMYNRYKTKLAACGVSFEDVNKCYILALFDAFIEEITTNGRATGIDSGGDSHNLNLE